MTATRRFTVYRRGDLSETHNADQVNAPDQPQYEGVVFSDGTTVLRWLTAARSTSVWADFETMWKVHGHDDPNSKHGTVIVWHDAADSDLATTEQVIRSLRAENERLRETLQALLDRKLVCNVREADGSYIDVSAWCRAALEKKEKP